MSSLIVIGSRMCNDKDLVFETINLAIQNIGFKVREIVSDTSKGVASFAEAYAKENGLNVVKFPANWDDISDCEPEDIRERWNQWKKRNEKYNFRAGFQRNERMLEYVKRKEGGVCSIDLNSGETKDVVKKAKELDLPIYEYEPIPIQPHEFGYNFWSNE